MSDPWAYLANNGPSPSEYLPRRPNFSERRDGVRKFTLTSGHGDIESLPARAQPIYYIEGKHDPKEVLKAFYEHNPRLFDELDNRVLHWKTLKMGDGFKSASYELLGPFGAQFDEAPDSTKIDWTCPLCGDSVSARYRTDHLEGHA